METKLVVAATSEYDFRVEIKHEFLNRIGFVRTARPEGQWHLLVTEAWNTTRFPVDETVKGYLVTMLNRFTRKRYLLHQLGAFDFNQYLLGHRRLHPDSIQDVADMALQYVAFFSERSRYRHETRSVEYVAHIGVTLYRQLAETNAEKNDCFSRAYSVMSRSFGTAVMVLRATCPRFALHKAPRVAAQSVAHVLIGEQGDKLTQGRVSFNKLHIEALVPKIRSIN